MKNTFKKLILSLALLTVIFLTLSFTLAPKRDFYQLKIYHLKNKTQESRLDIFLQNAYLPALHRAGITKIGVFKSIIEAGAAEPAEQLVYVFIPFKSEKEFLNWNQNWQQIKNI